MKNNNEINNPEKEEDNEKSEDVTNTKPPNASPVVKNVAYIKSEPKTEDKTDNYEEPVVKYTTDDKEESGDETKKTVVEEPETNSEEVFDFKEFMKELREASRADHEKFLEDLRTRKWWDK